MSKLKIRFKELSDLIPLFEFQAGTEISNAADVIVLAFKKGKKILVCGNGGSAADSQHLAAEFVNSFSKDLNRRALPAIALSTDSSILTSIANDVQFESVFSRQVSAYGNPGDILIALTTSGKSKNCIAAVQAANALQMVSIVLTKTNAEISSIAKISIEVPSQNTQHIQECHVLAYHVMAELVEDSLFREGMSL